MPQKEEAPKQEGFKNELLVFPEKLGKLRVCKKKQCVLAFIKKEFETEETLQRYQKDLENAQKYFNSANTQFIMIDAGCYHDKLQLIGL